MNRNTNVKKSYNKKGSKYDSKAKTNCKEMEASEFTGNDPKWYMQNPELVSAYTNIPFNVISNLPYPTSRDDVTGPYLAPSIAVLDVQVRSGLDSLGRGVSKFNVIQSYAQRMYSFVRHLNSGHANYEPGDLLMYVMAMAHCYSYINYCQRLLGMVQYYNGMNRAFPRALCDALRVDFDSIAKDICGFRGRLNLMIKAAQVMAVPANVPYLQRTAALYANYYIDSTDGRDQIYITNPVMFPKLVIADDNPSLSPAFSGYALLQTSFSPGRAEDKWTADNLIDFGYDLINAVVMEEDFGIISGDIIKAYGSNLITLQPVPDEFIVAPINDRTWLTQFRNAVFFKDQTTAGYPFLAFSKTNKKLVGNTDAEDICPRPAACMSYTHTAEESTAIYNKYAGAVYRDRVLRLDDDQLTPEWIMEATRFMDGYNSETIKECRIYSMNVGDDDDPSSLMYGSAHLVITMNATQNSAAVLIDGDNATHLSSSLATEFMYLPATDIFVCKCKKKSGETSWTVTPQTWYAKSACVVKQPIPISQCKMLAEVAWSSLLYSPAIAAPVTLN